MVHKLLRFLKPAFIETATDFKGKQIKVTRASEPTDVNWRNLGYTDRQKFLSRFYTNFTTFILISVSFGIILLVNYGEVQ